MSLTGVLILKAHIPTAAKKTHASSCRCSKIKSGTANKNMLVLYDKGVTSEIFFKQYMIST